MMVLRRNPAVLWRRTLFGILLLMPDGEYLELDAPGDTLWDLMAEPSDLEGLVERVVERFATPAIAVRSDIWDWVNRMQHRGALVNGPSRDDS